MNRRLSALSGDHAGKESRRASGLYQNQALWSPPSLILPTCPLFVLRLMLRRRPRTAPHRTLLVLPVHCADDDQQRYARLCGDDKTRLPLPSTAPHRTHCFCNPVPYASKPTKIRRCCCRCCRSPFLICARLCAALANDGLRLCCPVMLAIITYLLVLRPSSRLRCSVPSVLCP